MFPDRRKFSCLIILNTVNERKIVEKKLHGKNVGYLVLIFTYNLRRA